MAHELFASSIQACYACADACDHCAVACLDELGRSFSDAEPNALVPCIALDIDCADACRMAAAYLARDSEQVSAACEFCAQVCEACAAHCAVHDFAHCRHCAEACRRCADACRSLIKPPPSGGDETAALLST